MQHTPLQVDIRNFDVPEFKLPEPASVEHCQNKTVFKQGRGIEQLTHFLLAEHYRQLLRYTKRWQGDLSWGRVGDFVCHPEAIHDVFHIAQGRSVAFCFEKLKIVEHLFLVELDGRTLKVKGHGGQGTGVVVESALALAGNQGVSPEFGQQFIEFGN